jgi:hypothetical protein
MQCGYYYYFFYLETPASHLQQLLGIFTHKAFCHFLFNPSDTTTVPALQSHLSLTVEVLEGYFIAPFSPLSS